MAKEKEVNNDVLMTSRGLGNSTGENNCFLNVVIQSLWNLRSFRKQFFATVDHVHDGKDSCIFCELKKIFDYFEKGTRTSSVFEPENFRQQMANIFKKDARFQIGDTSDAAEALDALLSILHNSVTASHIFGANEFEDSECEPLCLVHKTFGLYLTESPVSPCVSCNDLMTKSNYSFFITYVISSSISDTNLQNILARQAQEIKTITCRKCNKEKVNISTTLSHPPSVYTVGMVLDSQTITSERAENVLAHIPRNIDLSAIYPNLLSHNNKNDTNDNTLQEFQYQLRGLIMYYGNHFYAYFYNTRLRAWIKFDDRSVTLVGTDWSDVMDKIIAAKSQPYIIFYELGNDDHHKSNNDDDRCWKFTYVDGDSNSNNNNSNSNSNDQVQDHDFVVVDRDRNSHET